jgi:hypothetical protein
MTEPVKPAAEPDKPAAESVQIGPRDVAGPTDGTILIQLVGGPRAGWQERIPARTTRVNIRHEGVDHEYTRDANLPADFASRTPGQHAPLVYFGYVGPDQEAVAQLVREHGGGDVKRGPEHGPAYGEAKGKPAKPLTSEGFPR